MSDNYELIRHLKSIILRQRIIIADLKSLESQHNSEILMLRKAIKYHTLCGRLLCGIADAILKFKKFIKIK